MTKPIVFLIDCDQTLLDNKQAEEHFRAELVHAGGPDAAERYWSLFEQQRDELGYADYLGTLQRLRLELKHNQHLARVGAYMLSYGFELLLYPGALAVIERLSTWGETVVVSDGDIVFQPRKIERAGLRNAVHGRVLVYIHKQYELEDIAYHYPAKQYVLIDDRPDILSAVKRQWGERVTTILIEQGTYAPSLADSPADITLAAIGDVLDFDLETLLHPHPLPLSQEGEGN